MADIKFTDFMADSETKRKSVEMPDGSLIWLPGIEFLPDAFFEAAKAEDHLAMGRNVLSPEDYDKWVSFGGSSAGLLSLLAKLNGMTLPNFSIS